MTALPLHVAALPDETWHSFLSRVAARNDCTVAELADHLHLRGPHGSWPGYYGVTIADDVAASVAPRLGLSRVDVQAMQLAKYDQLAFDLEGLSGARGIGATRATAHSAWIWLAGSTYCPACLADTDGAWQLAWRVPWITTCLIHEVNLQGDCPICGAVPGIGNRFNATAPTRPYAAPDGRRCSHPAPAGQVCGADLTAVSVTSSSKGRINRTRGMAYLMGGARGVVAGTRHTSLQALRAWQAAIGIAVRLGVVETGGWGRTHRWANPPRDPNLIDQLLAAVQPLISAPSVAEAADVLDGWCQSAGINSPHANTFDRITQPSVALRPVIDQVLLRHGRAHTVIQRRFTEIDEHHLGNRRWSVDDVPQLVWPCALPARARNSSRPDQRIMRVVVAMVLIRMCCPSRDWVETGAAMGIPPSKSRNWTRHAFSTKWGYKAELLAAAEQLAGTIHEQPRRTAWAARPLIEGYGVYSLQHAQQPACLRDGGDYWCPCGHLVTVPASGA